MLIGQNSFSNLQVPSQSVLGSAGGVAYANGKLWVADATTMNGLNPNNPNDAGIPYTTGLYPQDNRVLAFPTSSIPPPSADLTGLSNPYCNLCGFPANLVLGQVDFNSFAAGTAQTAASSTTGSLQSPTAVATDGIRLVVADTNNNRVLIWNSIPASNNAAPDIVLGQSSFSANGVSTTPSASSLRGPQGVWINPDGHLFVADSQDYRVLIWNHFPTSNNQAADVVLGQTNFTTGTQSACNPVAVYQTYTAAANELCNPASVTSDGTRVYVADLGFNRVLIWNSIPASNGQNADVVVGQPDMTSTAPNNTGVNYNFCPGGAGANGICANNMQFPRFVLADPGSNQLFVGDGGDNRVLIYSPIPTTNGAAASAVLGQPNFTTDVTSSAAISIASTTIDNTAAVDVIPTPTSLAYDSVNQNLYVADPTNNRVLVFTPAITPLPANSIVNWASEIIRQEGTVTFFLTESLGVVTGAINAGDTVSVTIASATYTYTIVKNDTLDTIAQGMVSAINSSNSGAGDPNASAIFAGTGTGSLYLSSKQVNPAYDSIALSATTSNSADISASTSSDFLTSGTGATGAAGMLVEINGTNLSDASPSNPAVAAADGTSNIPTTLGGAQVYFDGVAAPVYSASSVQIISQVPFNFYGGNSASVYVRTTHTDGTVTVTNASPLYIAAANPGIFNAPSTPNQPRPWPALNAYHQPGNATSVVSIDGTIVAGDIATITIEGKAYNYTVQASDSTTSVAQALINMINSAPDPNVTASLGSAFSRVVLTAIQSGAAGSGITIAGSSSSGASITVTAYTTSTCCNVTPNSLISPSNPAGPGELITMSTAGLGILTQPSNTSALVVPNTGQPYSGPQPNSAINTVSATMGGSTAEVINAGLAPQSYGVYQVQLIVPSSLTANATTQLDIAQNAFVSNTVTVAIGSPSPVSPTPPPSTSAIIINIDTPNTQSGNVSGTVPVGGWVVDTGAAVTSVEISVDGNATGTAGYGIGRPDVCAIYPKGVGCPNVGFAGTLDTTQFPDGMHSLQITATDANGGRATYAGSFTSSNYSGSVPTAIGIDSPATQSGPFQGSTYFSGWAFNTNASIPENGITVYIDGSARGTASYGLSRPDVCAAFGNEPGCPNLGWIYFIDTATLSNGNHTFAVRATAANGQYALQAHTFTVANWTTANPTIINIDTPGSQSGTFSGAVGFGGWALNRSSTIGIVAVSVDNIFYGNAAYGATRNDVCAVYPGVPGCPNVGWNISIDTTVLADGPHTLEVTAYPTSGSGFTTTTQFTVGNMPPYSGTRISIDFPNAQTGPLSGFTNVGGWAVNDTAAVSTVVVSVDGITQGYAAYGGVRADACAAIGNRQGCPNVGWNFPLNTTFQTNGTHTLEVTATSAAGQRATQGATFTVANSVVSGPTTVSITQPNSTNNPFVGLTTFSGTAASTSSQIIAVSVSVDGAPYAAASLTPLVGPNGTSESWTYLLNTVQLADGRHTFGATAIAADGTYAVASATFVVANWQSPDPVLVNIDVPGSSTGVVSGSFAIGGWAVDQSAVIATVSISVDGISFGNAMYGGTRSDVCAVYSGGQGCPNVGWNSGIDTTYLSNGAHTLAVTATTVNGQSSTSTATFTVAN